MYRELDLLAAIVMHMAAIVYRELEHIVRAIPEHPVIVNHEQCVIVMLGL